MDAKVPTRLHQLRLEAGLSQNKLARLADLDRKTISDVENATNNPQEVTLAKIAQALTIKLGREIKISDIYDLSGE